MTHIKELPKDQQIDIIASQEGSNTIDVTKNLKNKSDETSEKLSNEITHKDNVTGEKLNNEITHKDNITSEKLNNKITQEDNAKGNINEITTFDEKEYELNKSVESYDLADNAYDERWYNLQEFRGSEKEFVLTDKGYELKNNSKTWFYTKDIGLGLARGVVKMTEGVGGLALGTLEQLNLVSDGSVENFAKFYQTNIYEKMGDTETLAGGLSEGLGQFIIPGVGAYGIFAKLIKAKGVFPFIYRALAAEATTVGVAHVPGDPNIASMFAQLFNVDTTKADSMAKEFYNYLATPDIEYGASYNADDVFSEKLRAIIGDMPMGPVGELLFPLFKMFAKGMRKLRGNKEMINEIDKNIVKADEKVVLPGITEKDVNLVSAKDQVKEIALIKSNFVKHIKNNPEGFTISIDGTVTPNKGFAVAPLKSTEYRVEADTINMDDIDIFAQNIFALRKATDENINVYAGGWLDTKNNQYVLDAVHIIDNEADALYVAQAGNQEAIFDLGNLNEIRTDIGINKLKEGGTYESNKANVFGTDKDKLAVGFEEARDTSSSITKKEDLNYQGTFKKKSLSKAPTPENGSPGHEIYSLLDEAALKELDTPTSSKIIKFLKSIDGNPEKKVIIYRAIPKDAKNKIINPGDFVTFDKDYVIRYAKEYVGKPTYTMADVKKAGGFDKVRGTKKNKGYVIVAKEVKAKELYNYGPVKNDDMETLGHITSNVKRFVEWGYWPKGEGSNLSKKSVTESSEKLIAKPLKKEITKSFSLTESWSKKYYTGLTEEQHKANDAWFVKTLGLLKEDGFLKVPNIKKSFNKQGKEIEIIEGSESPKEIK